METGKLVFLPDQITPHLTSVQHGFTSVLPPPPSTSLCFFRIIILATVFPPIDSPDACRPAQLLDVRLASDHQLRLHPLNEFTGSIPHTASPIPRKRRSFGENLPTDTYLPTPQHRNIAYLESWASPQNTPCRSATLFFVTAFEAPLSPHYRHSPIRIVVQLRAS